MIGLSLSLTRAGVPRAFAELNLLSASLDPRINFTRASTKTYIGADGLLHTAAVNECPLEYDPVTLQPAGRSAWEARTNLLLWSSDASNAAWNQDSNSKSVVAGAAPDGSGSVNRFTSTAGGTFYPRNGFSVANSTTYTLSGWVRSFGQDPATVALAAYHDAAWGTGGQITLSAQWKRVQYTFTVGASGGSSTGVGFKISGAIGVGVEWWGFQIEAAATASPYIPTTTAQVTRAADVATVDDLSTIRFNATAGTFFIEHSAPAGTVLLKSGGNTIVTSQGPGKIAVSYDASGSYITSNGGATTTGPALTFGSSLTIADSNAPLNRIRYYPRKLTDAERGSLTA